MNTISSDAATSSAGTDASETAGPNPSAAGSGAPTNESGSPEQTRAGLPPEWMGRPFVESRGIDRVRFFGVGRTPDDKRTITWHLRGGATHYGVGTYHSSFADRGQSLSFGRRVPTDAEIDAALFLARHRIESGAWSGPLSISGTDRYKGAVLARAVELDIPLGNPELVTLQDILRRQKGLPSTDERINTLYGNGQRQTTNVAAAPADANDTPPPDEPFEQRLNTDPPTPSPTAAATNEGERLRSDLQRILALSFSPEEILEAGRPPSTHAANEVQTYEVVVANASELGISFGDGSYIVVPRTDGTQNVQPESLVMVRTDAKGNIRAVAPYEEHTHIIVPTASAPTDPEIVFKNAAPLEVTGFGADLARSVLDGDARTALATMNVAEARMKEVPFVLPTKNTSLTVLARNEAGFALKINNWGQYALVDPGKIPLPDIAAGGQVAFRVVDGTMRAMTTDAAKRLDAARPRQTVAT